MIAPLAHVGSVPVEELAGVALAALAALRGWRVERRNRRRAPRRSG
jgi:hypothetical protein